MRIDTFSIGHSAILVYLDGARQHLCEMADTDTGEIVRVVVDQVTGAPVSNGNGRALRETVRGKVELRLHPGAVPFIRRLYPTLPIATQEERMEETA